MMSLNEKLSSERSLLILYPDSGFRATWDIFAFMFILYQSLVLPLRMSFEIDWPAWFIWFDLGQDVFFIIDVLLSFNTGFYGKGALIMRRKQIILRYIKTW